MTEDKHIAYKTAAQMVRKTKQVVLLYEGAIKHIQIAMKAIDEDEIELRYNSLTQACEIINGLQMCLDMEKGGEVAQLLYDYYAGMDMRLMSVHYSNDTELCEACVKHLRMMLEAWDEIDQTYEDEDNPQGESTSETQDAGEEGMSALEEESLDVSMYGTQLTKPLETASGMSVTA